jgi:hypothetical protein
MTARQELLEKLYLTWWHDISTLESDEVAYSWILWTDAAKMDEICEQIEAIDNGVAA